MNDIPKIRGVILDANFLKWPRLRQLQKQGWIQSVDWLLTLVFLARDALNGGRIELSGVILSAEEIADHMPSHRPMQPFDESWLAKAVELGILDLHPDGCYAIPNWSMWHKDRDSQAANFRNLPMWGGFLENWFDKFGEAWVSTGDLIEVAAASDVRGSSGNKSTESKKQWLGKRLSSQVGAPCNGYYIERGQDSGNKSKYRLRRT